MGERCRLRRCRHGKAALRTYLPRKPHYYIVRAATARLDLAATQPSWKRGDSASNASSATRKTVI